MFLTIEKLYHAIMYKVSRSYRERYDRENMFYGIGTRTED